MLGNLENNLLVGNVEEDLIGYGPIGQFLTDILTIFFFLIMWLQTGTKERIWFAVNILYIALLTERGVMVPKKTQRFPNS